MPIDENRDHIKINPDDLPTLFQVSIAQESNANQIESLHDLFQRQQNEIDSLKETLKAQHEVLKRIVDDMV